MKKLQMETRWKLFELLLLVADALLLGVLIGWLTSPFQKNQIIVDCDMEDLEEEEEDEEE